MSALLYGAMTRKRVEAPKDESTTDDGQPGIKTYADSMAALVPADVIVIHGLVVEVTTETKKVDGKAVTTITDPAVLKAMFWVGIVLSMVLFAAGRLTARKGKWGGWDYARLILPALAFVLWAILQKTTAFDALAPDSLSEGARLLIGLTGAVLVGLAAAGLGIKADKAESNVPAVEPEREAEAVA